jgi:3-deoxy-D-manno-octulosonic-acid transferase
MIKPDLDLVAYRILGRSLALVAPFVLRRRLARGKESPERWHEKLGQSGLARPQGRLIWLHGVGLGEVMALRGVVLALHALAPDLNFLVTSSTRVSAEVFSKSALPNTRHQFLPLDAPVFLKRFFDHWQPDLVIWSEQDIWPGAIFAAAQRKIAQCYINARITEASFKQRRRLRGLYVAALRQMALVSAQDTASEVRLAQLGASGFVGRGSLKPFAPALTVDGAELASLRALLDGRPVLIGASSHAGDEAELIRAMERLKSKGWLCVLVPRDIGRADVICKALTAAGLSYMRRSEGELPSPETDVLLADSYGEMGLWYALGDVALVGGGFDAIGGHNPWEAVALDTAVLHGPDTYNFVGDYELLDSAGGALAVIPSSLSDVMPKQDERRLMREKATKVRDDAAKKIDCLVVQILALLRPVQ